MAGPLFSYLNLYQKDRDTLIEQSSQYTLIEHSVQIIATILITLLGLNHDKMSLNYFFKSSSESTAWHCIELLN